jgi:hypothetical protein
MKPTRGGGIRRAVLIVLVNVLVLLIVEGVASLITVGRIAIDRMRTLAEHVHTRYDAELGWVNMPNVFVPDMYGPGRFFRTNAQGFRNADPVTTTVPAGRVRVVCSGDSFTLGYGVSNDQAWCNHLAAIDPRLEPVNMGQGGYGLDQTYLWYRRDGVTLDQDLQILAFITVDFARMRSASFLGYPKPVLALAQGELAVHGVPVPYRSEFGAKRSELVRTLASFRTVQVLRSLVPSRPPPGADAASDTPPADPLRPIVARLFATLRDVHQAHGSRLVLVYLPMRTDYDDEASDGWRRFVRETADRDRIACIDLVDDLRSVPRREIDAYFIQPGETPYGHAEGHYTARGNDFIARVLYQKLGGPDAVATKFAALPTGLGR